MVSIYDIPANPFWLIATGSHQVAFVLMVVLLVASVYYTSKPDKAIHAIALGVMAAVSGLLSFGLFTAPEGETTGMIMLAFVLACSLAFVTAYFVFVFARQVQWTIVFGLAVISTAATGFALEMSLERDAAMAASNLMLWFTTLLLIGALVAKFWPSSEDQTESTSYREPVEFDQRLETSPN